MAIPEMAHINSAVARLNAAVATPFRAALELNQAENFIRLITHRQIHAYLEDILHEMRAAVGDSLNLRRIRNRLNDKASLPNFGF